MRARLALVVLALATGLACATAPRAGEAPASGPEATPLRVGTSGDYAPFSVRGADGRPGGLDVEVARAFARDTGRTLRLVPFRWPALLEDLAAGRFDVAMSGVTVRPERSLAGRFSVPVAESGAVALAPPERAAEGLAGLDRPGVRIAVNAGGHLERTVRALLPRATPVPVPDNAAVLDALGRGAADAVVTDTREAPHWEARRPGLVRLGPFTRDRKAYLLPPDAGPLAAELDAWLLARERDGTLGALRRSALGEETEPVATPLGALVAALDERLALMPWVADAKRAAGAPIHVPAQEERVLAAALEATRREAVRAGLPAPPEAAVAGFFRAQFAAARALQRARLAGPAAPGPPPDLDGVLRPALLRIGERIARLVVRLPADAGPEATRAFVRAHLATPGLAAGERDALADAVAALVAAPRRAPTPGAAAGPR